ncbi:coronatine-insensitive protein homolog 1a-like isoform X2 [Lolium rigidum]|nr:coronatine-insensitive protein homolog 1a-like isoform X2 [Lolium rigidum]XP_047055309.1 coronatine-insensitive protein homolog 1a-like isoform X2 [Lolium rigidum]XP_047055310.1 coronatine-insensitive protein homolog 1a-like isoform X2 [Lolium rigidum]XP_047055311.1 coronatine-insensitive protein homolog 1a-like isoform X2 [Lolium rigidum]XP_047055312.1 coronatine-insensitive protein homolog 1a-like isoform X2 [Lolium rigidum]XP_047055313.1 coronatine-insensitive protein homolog 1a-like iso
MGGEVPEPRRLTHALSFGGVPDEALHLVLGHVDAARDREAASLVCRRWHRIDALTRKHVTVGFCYAAGPARLLARFPTLESLALKGKPRAAMYGLIPEDWGAYAAPWVAALAAPLDCLKALKLRRMTVTDADVAALVRARGHMLQELRLDKCSGFSTDTLRLGAAFSQGGGGGDAAFSQGGGSLSLLHSQSQISQASREENLLSPRHPSPARDQ